MRRDWQPRRDGKAGCHARELAPKVILQAELGAGGGTAAAMFNLMHPVDVFAANLHAWLRERFGFPSRRIFRILKNPEFFPNLSFHGLLR